jgi:hypothetical protein
MVITERQLKAIANLGPNPDFEIFVDYLAEWLLEEIKQMTYSENPLLAQGRNQVLRELSQTIENARASAAKRVSARAVDMHRSNAF